MAENIKTIDLSTEEMIDLRKTALTEAVKTLNNLPMSNEEIILRAISFENFLLLGDQADVKTEQA